MLSLAGFCFVVFYAEHPGNNANGGLSSYIASRRCFFIDTLEMADISWKRKNDFSAMSS
jgi:hypothetical protein